MPVKLSIYLDGNTYVKLCDIKRAVEHGPALQISISKAVTYAILTCWRHEFVESLTEFSDVERETVAKYTPVPEPARGVDDAVVCPQCGGADRCYCGDVNSGGKQ
jgi:hypothetical protein